MSGPYCPRCNADLGTPLHRVRMLVVPHGMVRCKCGRGFLWASSEDSPSPYSAEAEPCEEPPEEEDE